MESMIMNSPPQAKPTDADFRLDHHNSNVLRSPLCDKGEGFLPDGEKIDIQFNSSDPCANAENVSTRERTPHSEPVKVDSEATGIRKPAGSEDTRIEKPNSENGLNSSNVADDSQQLTDRFESTLAHFLRTETDISTEHSQEEIHHPISSVYDLLSEETRDYLSKHCNYSSGRCETKVKRGEEATSRVSSQRIKRDEVEDTFEPPPVNDALTNYMRTMQRYIGRSTFQSAQPQSVVASMKKSTPPSKSSSFSKYGYESIDNCGRNLDPSVRRWLISLRLPNLGKYLTIFDDNEVDKESLKLLTESQLRRMGINSYGPLNKMLHSIRVMRNCEPPRICNPKAFISEPSEVNSHSPEGIAKSTERHASPKSRKPRSSSAPNSARRNVAPTDLASKRNDIHFSSPKEKSSGSDRRPRNEKCLLRLLVTSSKTPPSSARSAPRTPGRDPPQSARSQLSEKELVKKAEKDIERAAKKFQSKLDKDAEKQDTEERLNRRLREKRFKFAADYRRRQVVAQEVAKNHPINSEDAPHEDKIKRNSRPRKDIRRIQPPGQVESRSHRNKENISKDPANLHVETQMGIDAEKPNLIFEDQLDDLELQIQNLVDMQTLKQSDSRSLLSCIDHLQNQLHHIQSMVSRERATAEQKTPRSGKNAKRSSEVNRNEDQKPPASPRTDSSQMDLHFNERDYIGEGMFTQVIRGKYMKKEVAIKRLKTPLTTDDKISLAQEVNLLMELRQENIALILGCVVRMKFPLLIMEYCPGGSLHLLLQKSDPLDHCAFYQIAEDVCAGLNYLHVGSTLSPRPHLRLTSHNVLLDLRLRARLSDVGLSRLRHECSRAIRQAGAARSDWSQLPWMAPEVLAGEEAGPVADVYSLGVLLWEMLMRQTPYNGLTTYQMMERIRDGPPLTLPDSCPVGLRGLIRRCWQLKPMERTTVQEALLSLSRLKFPITWQTVLQSAGLSASKLTDVYFCRRLIAHVLNLTMPSLDIPARVLPPGGPCGVLSSPIPDLELTPVSRIEELAEKICDFVSRESGASDVARSFSPLSAELLSRGAVWAERRGGRLHDQ